MPSRRREAIVVALGGALVLAAYAAIYFPFLPAAAGKLGHDWAYYLPQQLAGLYWLIENGPFAIPWFTPGFCGGVPFYADPNNLYVSLPQALVWGLDPVLAARITLVAFAAAGFVGTYALLRRVFETGAAAAFLGAVLFATNGFFGARLIIGHIGFHSYMLVPAIAYWLLARPRPGDVFASVAAGLAFAYAYQSADVHGVPIAVLALCGLYFIDAWRRGFSWRPPARLAAAAALALALSAAKLSANLSFLASFPRTGYPLPGAQSVLDALRLAAMGLFGAPSSEAAMRVIVNTRFALGRHEFEYGVTWLAPAVIGLGGAIALVRRRWRWNGGRAVAAGGLALVLALPIALTVYAPEWHAVLKRIPVIASSSNLFRWYAAYIPLLAVGAALAFDAIPWRGAIAASAVLAAGVLVLHWLPDRTYYAEQPYRPGTVAAAMRLARTTGRAPPVDTIAAVTVVDGRARLGLARNDAIALGSSFPLCYQPLFGYRLEWFPLGSLQPGSVFARVGDGAHYNLKNPACYVFPGANGCRPGDHFRLDQRAEMVRFLAYRPFAFARPWWQRAAEAVNLAALAALVVMVGYGLALPRER